jgi:hypothetical protein
MLESPRFAAGSSWPYDPFEVQLPILRYSSDIMMAYWLRNNPNPKNLRYYFALNVQEDSTRLLIAKVLQDMGHAELSIWPGLKVSKGSKEFDILLGEHCSLAKLPEYSCVNEVSRLEAWCDNRVHVVAV